jgi:hypothetical protein
MGIEYFGEKIENMSFKDEFRALTKEEKKARDKVKEIFLKKAKLDLLLASDDLDMTKHQRVYYGSHLNSLGKEAKDIFDSLPVVKDYKMPNEFSGVKAADNRDEKEAA